MHVCVFTTAHPWDDVRVRSKFVDSFLSSGDHVTWVGPDRAFFESSDAKDSRIEYRVVTSAPGWKARLTAMRTLRATLASTPDIDWVYTPDPDAAALALTVPGLRVVFDIHEEYHKGHLAQSVPSSLRSSSERTVRNTIAAIAARCHLVTAVNQSILDAYGVGKDKGFVTFNTPPAWFVRSGRASADHDGAVRFFHGKALAGNGTSTVLDALAETRRRGVDARVVMFPSNGPLGSPPYDPSFSARSHESDITEGLDLLPGQPHRLMPSAMGMADVGLIAYDRNLGGGSLPNRFFEYMALGMPALVPHYSPLMRDIVEREMIGATADFEDPCSVADAMCALASDVEAISSMGGRARASFASSYAWETSFNRFRSRLVATL